MEGSNRTATKSPHLLHRCLTSQQDGTTVKAVCFDPQFNQNRVIGHPPIKSSNLDGKHGVLGGDSRMGERMNALGTAQVTTWDLACGPSLAVTTHQDASNAPTHTLIFK